MKKGFLAVFLISALAMAIGFTACSSGGNASSDASSGASSEAASAESSAASAESASAESSEASSEAVSAESAAEVDGSAYGYAGTDPVEAAVYKYAVEEIGKNFEKADVSIPIVSIVHEDYTNPDDVIVYGDFWLYNYNIEGETLECESGGDFPGVMHLKKDGEGYTVSSFDMVADGADFDSSAKELFGDNYDALMKVMGDDKARDELRKATVSDYVNMNGLDVTQYQDYGWDPVPLYK